MPKPKVYHDRTKISLRLPVELLERVDETAQGLGQSRNATCVQALTQFIRAERIRQLTDSALFQE